MTTHRLTSFLQKYKYWVLLLLMLLFLLIWTTPTVSTPGTTKIWDRNHILLYESTKHIGRKDPVSFETFPKDLINATVASEDESFWSNPGFDLKAIFRSAVLNIQQRKIVTGASTITQQLTRVSSSYTTESPIASFIRKTREILMAIRLYATYSKKDVLTLYLNQVYYGNLSYGAQAAARTYFGKDVSSLSLSESAFLTGLLSSPGNRDPYTNIHSAKKQQARVLDAMVHNNYISRATAEQAKKQPLHLSSLNDTGDIKAPHFVHYVLSQLENLNIKTKKGIAIQTTLDYPTFLLSQTIARIWVKKLADEHDLSNAALVLLDNNTGEILSMLGGIDYFDTIHAGQENMTTALRQPGSALKPITYATAFAKGYTPATLMYDVPKVYMTKKGEGYTPNNYDGRYHGLVLARDALGSSLNLPAVEMLSRIGLPAFLDSAKRLGITTFTQDNRYDLSLTLGGGEITLLDLTNVYASFGRGGAYKPTYAIESVIDDDGKLIYHHVSENQFPSFGSKSTQISYLISNILSDPKARLFGFYEKNPLVLSHPAAAKTGTTTDWHDNWTIGYTPSYTVGVWVGNNDNHPMKEITGIIGAAPIWQQFFEEFLKDKPIEQFQKPEGVETAVICTVSGQLPDSLCPTKRKEFFLSGTKPKEVTTIFKKVRVDIRNNLLTSSSCPSEFTTEKVFIDYPPQVYSWAKINNQEVIPTRYSPFCDKASTQQTTSYLEITSPKPKAVFQSAPELVSHQAIVFEANVSADIMSVSWYVNNKLLQTTSTFPFSTSWDPTVGKYVVEAKATTTSGKQILSTKVPFTVVGFGN